MTDRADPVVIHPAITLEELEQVRALMREYMDFLLNHPTGSAHLCIGGFENEIASLPAGYAAPGGILLARIGAQPAGCIALRELRVGGPMAAVHKGEGGEGGGLALELKRLWVRPGGRGVGLGRRLVEAALAYAHQYRAVAVFLDTVPAAMPEATGARI